uniref:Uncharacterized protein n=1 Tax=Tetranychus urticae TaxID=32264 RepID=T1JVH9_TETUR
MLQVEPEDITNHCGTHPENFIWNMDFIRFADVHQLIIDENIDMDIDISAKNHVIINGCSERMHIDSY